MKKKKNPVIIFKLFIAVYIFSSLTKSGFVSVIQELDNSPRVVTTQNKINFQLLRSPQGIISKATAPQTAKLLYFYPSKLTHIHDENFVIAC